MRSFRLAAVAASLLLTSIVVTACAASPEGESASPTPMFASDEEAFAAAEAPYRAYVDASNQVDLSDPTTFDAALELSAGDLNAADRKVLSAKHADGYTLSGQTVVESITMSDISTLRDNVALAVCLNVSQVDVRDAAGNSSVDPGRNPVQALRVSFAPNPRNLHSLAAVLIEPNEVPSACE